MVQAPSQESHLIVRLARTESAHRTKHIIFCFFDPDTHALNLPSALLVRDICIHLPCLEISINGVPAAPWLRNLHRLFHSSQASLSSRSVKPCYQLKARILFNLFYFRPVVNASYAAYIIIYRLLQYSFTLLGAEGRLTYSVD